MISLFMNLLPWRDLQKQHCIKKFIQAVCLWGICIIATLYLFYFLSNEHNQKHRTMQEQIQQQLKLLAEYHRKIQLLKQQKIEANIVPYINIPHLLKKLSYLPLKQSALTELNLQNNNVILKGISRDQTALDELTTFLKQQPEIMRLQLQGMNKEKAQITFSVQFTLQTDNPK